MKKFVIKFVSVFLSLVILATSALTCSFAVQKEAGIPTVYVEGQGSGLHADKDNPDSESIYPLKYDLSAAYIKDFIKKLNPIFAKAYITGNYDEYCNVLYNAVDPIYSKIRLDKNGEATNNSGNTWTWSLDTLHDEKVDGEYDLFAYVFHYDWRLDPCATADRLSSYINDVRTVTGSSKVNVVCRCLGCDIVASYIYEYGSSLINKCVVYCGTLEGTAACSKTFSGQIRIDPDGLERFAYDRLDDKTLMTFVKESVSFFNKTKGLDLMSDFVDSVYKKVKSNLVPRLLIATYATFPSYWSMIGEDYEEAKTLVFGKNTAEYAGLISKIDHYHYDIQANIRTILTNAKNNGTDIAIIAKYGYQIVPVVPNSDDITDGVVEVRLASLGATATKVNSTFSDEYINKAKANGTFKYISADRQVDASTCLFPDYTWIIKGIEHKNFPDCIDELIKTFLSTKGQMTVNDYAEYPQYLVYDENAGTISPMNSTNAGVTNWPNDSFFKTVIKLLKSAFALLKEYLPTLLKNPVKN
jgi:hypothetical protein